jgi:hypothetical protein
LTHDPTALRRTAGTVLSDIRLFDCMGRPAEGAAHQYAGKVFAVPPSVAGRANRVALLCARDRVYLGKRSLYACFSPLLADGEVLVSDFRTESWQQYVLAGLPAGYDSMPDVVRAQSAWDAVCRCLRATVIACDGPLLEAAIGAVEAGGDEMRFPLRAKITAQYEISLAHTVPTFPGPARLWLTLRERKSGVEREVVLFEARLPWEAAALGGPIQVVDDIVVVRTPTSGSAAHYARKHGIAAFEVPVQDLLRDGMACAVRRPPGPG